MVKIKTTSYISIIIFFTILTSYCYSENFNVEGRILNQDGEVVPTVKLVNKNTKKSVYSGSNGLFSLSLTKDEEITLKIQKNGYFELDTTFVVKNDYLTFFITEKYTTTNQVVVTGSKTPKEIKTSPIPTEVVTAKDIKNQGNLRLTDVLSDQVGLSIVQTPVKGIQTQGLNPDYTLILINGEPMIGRTRGTMDLERFSMGNVERVEIVKGPSSSLYGSSALAGVINIITEKPTDDFSGSVSARYGTFNTINLEANTQFSLSDKFGMNIFGNRLSTSGYKLVETAIGLTQPETVDYTISSDIFYNLSSSTKFTLTPRFNYFQKKNIYQGNLNSKVYDIQSIGVMKDINVAFQAKHNYKKNSTIVAKVFYAKMSSNENEDAIDTVANVLHLNGYEDLFKTEFQYNRNFGNDNLFTFGFGYRYEGTETDIEVNTVTKNHSYFSYAQDDWTPMKSLNVIGSLRYDKNTNYESSLSPKIAASWQIFDDFFLKGSIGTGFKAPESDQLYLDWNNSQSSYKVYGVTLAKKRIEDMQALGQILEIYRDLNTIKNIYPENSLSFNFGFLYSYKNVFELSVNGYRNTLQDMIDLQKVAMAKNGQNLWTYFNLKSVLTEGVETRVRYSPISNLTLDVSYNFLITEDLDDLKRIRNKELWKRDANGNERPVTESEYGGLFGRSTHSGVVKLSYNIPSINFNAAIRGNYRTKYGYKDMNVNLVLDEENEYAPGYTLWNLTLNKTFFEYYTLQFGIDNIFDEKDLRFLSANPGRIIYMNFTYRFN
jgi:outer membrane receptor for ferrienterochelin and colicins